MRLRAALRVGGHALPEGVRAAVAQVLHAVARLGGRHAPHCRQRKRKRVSACATALAWQQSVDGAAQRRSAAPASAPSSRLSLSASGASPGAAQQTQKQSVHGSALALNAPALRRSPRKRTRRRHGRHGSGSGGVRHERLWRALRPQGLARRAARPRSRKPRTAHEPCFRPPLTRSGAVSKERRGGQNRAHHRASAHAHRARIAAKDDGAAG